MGYTMNVKYVFTVFTSTYNRAYVLRRAFNSLQLQTFKDFEWVVVDDGSNDGTGQLVRELAQEASFPVRYFFQTHGHTKKAINRGVREAQGELFVFLDSDDELMPSALERINFYWKNIPIENRSHICGVFGLCQYINKRIVGATFPQDYMITSLNDMLFRYKVCGDKNATFFVDILRNYPFPEDISGLVPEGTVWCKMSRRYFALFVNEIFSTVHISEDSITPKKRFGSFMQKRAEGRALCASELLSHELRKYFLCSPYRFCVEAIMYVRSSLHIINKDNLPRVSCIWGRLLVFILYPIGLFCAGLDKIAKYKE